MGKNWIYLITGLFAVVLLVVLFYFNPVVFLSPQENIKRTVVSGAKVGEIIEVSIDVSIPAQDFIYISEFVPDGMEIVDTSYNGIVKESNKAEWGIVSEDSSIAVFSDMYEKFGLSNLSEKILTYKIKADSPGTYVISGKFYVDDKHTVYLTDNSEIVVIGKDSGNGRGGGGGGGGGGGPRYATYRINQEVFEQGYTVRVKRNDRIKFSAENTEHTIILKSVDSDAVEIEVSSESQTALLRTGDEKYFDVTGDSEYDLSVKLEKIESGTAELIVKKYQEEEVKKQEEVFSQQDTHNLGKRTDIQEQENNNITYIIMLVTGVIIIGILLGVVYIIQKKNPNKNKK
jgi:hypothetical protein